MIFKDLHLSSPKRKINKKNKKYRKMPGSPTDNLTDQNLSAIFKDAKTVTNFFSLIQHKITKRKKGKKNRRIINQRLGRLVFLHYLPACNNFFFIFPFF